VRGLAADIGAEAEHHLLVEARGDGRRKVVSDDDARLLEPREVHRLLVADEIVDDARGNITQVGNALAQVVVRQRLQRLGEALGDGVEGPFRSG